MTHGEEFLTLSRDYLANDYVPRIVAVLRQLEDADIWWRPNEASNSIGNLVLHLAGNARQWIVAGVGGAADIRQRPAEFAQREVIPGERLVAHLQAELAEVDRALARVTPNQLLETRRIQGIETSVLGAIYHVVEHFSGHVGQIVMIAKLRLGRDLGFWEIGEDGVARQTWRSGDGA